MFEYVYPQVGEYVCVLVCMLFVCMCVSIYVCESVSTYVIVYMSVSQ